VFIFLFLLFIKIIFIFDFCYNFFINLYVVVVVVEPEMLEAMVLFDFNARSSREMTLKKGDSVILIKQVSPPVRPPNVQNKQTKIFNRNFYQIDFK